jgi:Na+/proline symporter
MGLLLAGLFAAVMSSLDSSANSITTLVVCDWLPHGRELSVRLSKLLCGAIGLAAIGAALLVPHLGENVFDIIITIAGAFFGPMLGLFALGMLVRRANARGAAWGLFAGAAGVAVAASTAIPADWLAALAPGYFAELTAMWPKKISPWWYGAFGCVPTLVVGWLASYLAPPPDEKRVQKLLIFRRPT